MNTRSLKGNALLQPATYNAVGAGNPGAKLISYRSYFLLLGGLTMLGFLVMAAAAFLMYSPEITRYFAANPSMTTGIMIGSCVASIGGIILQFIGMRHEENPRLGLIVSGYILLIASLGISASFILQQYHMNSIIAAFLGTGILAAVMTVAGFTFPRFFQRVAGVLFIALIGVVIAEIVLMFLGISQGITDWIVLIIFCGFIGVDTYRATYSRPTYANAIFWASSIYIDLINIFIRLLALFGNNQE